MDEITKTINAIKTLKIQGATNVALKGISLLTLAKTKKQYESIKKKLIAVRPTEPMLRNGIKYVDFLKATGFEVKTAVEKYKQLIKTTQEEAIKKAAKKIKRYDVIMTHCHSSTVVKAIINANEESPVKVIVSETRPLYQGRITAKELAKAGVKTTLIVDSAMRSFIKKADACFIGADAITAEGNVVNKIGSAVLSLCALNERKPFFSITELLKFDPETLKKPEPIEQRNPEEVLKTKMRNLKIENPAFEVIPKNEITKIITELGEITPSDAYFVISNTYRWMF